MEKVLVLGTIGIDTLETPFGKAENILGGSAMYASFAASFYSQPLLLSIKGLDLEDSKLNFLKERNISFDGVETKGKNFRWAGSYDFDMNEAKTLHTEINSLAEFNPILPEEYKKAKYIFLGNTDPEIQLKVINSLENPEVIVLDTMNFWIKTKKEHLLNAIKKSHILVFNEWEARQLFETPSLVKCAKHALTLGLEAVIIKKGEHGALLYTKEGFFNCPGYPLEQVIDPTGCGDTFGGSFLAHYSKHKNLRKAIVYGSVIASFNAEGFGVENTKKLTNEMIEQRFQEMQKLREF